MTDLERKVQELGRYVLGGDVVLYADPIAILDAVQDRIAAITSRDGEGIHPRTPDPFAPFASLL